MGINSSSFHVTFDRGHPTIYYAGEIISGHVQCTIRERTDRINEIYLAITGEVGFTRKRQTRMQNGQAHRVTDCHEIRIFAQKVLLDLSDTCEQRENLAASNSLSTLSTDTITPGRYKYPFSLRLPDHLPPTLHQDSYPFVRYRLQVNIN
jgi:hypothetical protein